MTDTACYNKEDQNRLFAELAGRALLQPEYREAILKYPDSVLAQAGLQKEYRDALVKALSAENLGQVEIKDVPDLFGANRWGVGGSVL